MFFKTLKQLLRVLVGGLFLCVALEALILAGVEAFETFRRKFWEQPAERRFSLGRAAGDRVRVRR